MIRDHVVDFVHNFFVRNMISQITSNGCPLFQEIVIETINQCNGSCQFCPVNRRNDPRKTVLMDYELFKKIISELRDMDYRGLITMNGNNEPLLDKRLPLFLEYLRKELPECKIHMCTNGMLLDNLKLQQIMQNINHLLIDNYRGERGKKSIESLNINRFKADSITVYHIDPLAVRTTRAGQAPNKKVTPRLISPCIYPFVQFNIRSDGGVNQCCNDALGKSTMGNAKDQSIIEIWYGDKFNRVRNQLLTSRQNNELCKECDVFLTFPDWFIRLKRMILGRGLGVAEDN